MRYLAYINNKEHRLEIDGEGTSFRVNLNGKTRNVDLRRLPSSGTLSLLVDGRPVEAQVSGDGQQVAVNIRGLSLSVSIAEEDLFRRKTKKDGAAKTGEERVLAPMPGLVVSVKVKPGDSVTSGQPVVVIEAMKMQNELFSKMSGKIKEVRVKEQEKVDSGQVLMVVSPS